MNTTWKKEIEYNMKQNADSFENVISGTLSEEELNEEFYDGCKEWNVGRPFSLWTKKRVYFPASNGGSEWADSVSREPDNVPTHHIGGF